VAFIRNYAKLRSEGYQLAFPADNVWLFRLLYPFAITFLNTGQSLGDISPLFLGLLPVVLHRPVSYRARTSRPFSFVIAAAAVTLLVWLLITSMVFEIRYVIFLWILLFMPVAVWASAAFEDPDVLIRGLVRLAIISMLVFNALRTIYIALDTYSPVSKQGNAHCYDFEPCAILTPVNQMALPGDRVLMLDAFRYYLRSDLFACSTTNAEYPVLQKLSRTDNIAFWTEAYREGNSFVVYQQVYGVRHLNLGIIPNPYNTPPWLTLVPIAGRPGDTEVVYRLIAINPPVAIEKKCVDTGDWWEVQLDDATTFIHREAPVSGVTDWVVELR
jgi:hypothetical protein